MKPLLSIVIANYNYGRFLEEAIRSVIEQDGFDQCELIIVDGGSTDNSVEVIKKYEHKIAWWVSEPDKGQSDAFNKGFAQARGRFLTWLNADDVMLPRAVECLRVAAERNPDCQWFTGGCFWLDSEMRIIKCGRARPFSEMRYQSGVVNVNGPSSFFAKKLFERVGGVDIRFKYTMDSDLWLRFARHGARYRVAADYAFGLRLHPDAKMSGHNFKNGVLRLSKKAEEDENKCEQLRLEQTWRLEFFAAKPFTTVRRLLSASWIEVLRGKIDSYRWEGRKWAEVIR